MKIQELFDPQLLLDMHDQRYINIQHSPDDRLRIANYSSNAQFDRVWNDVTMNCRGLIYEAETGEIIARGYKKFFNWDDSSQPYPPTGPMLRAPKMDGSLGILYWDESSYRHKIATRGSFQSDQAIKATEMFYAMKDRWSIDPHEGKTYLFEIIYPDNRIVVNYGDAERLVLLDILDTDTGKADIPAFDAFNWPDKAEKVNMPGFADTMAGDIPPGEEGFVLYWPQKDFRTKMKAAEYLELHRMIFGLNERMIWQRLGDGETVHEIADALPDEFYPWVEGVASRLEAEAGTLIRQVLKDYMEIRGEEPVNTMTRKEFAAKAIKYPTSQYLFLYFDGKTISDAIWKTLRPVGGKGISLQSEDVA